MKMQFEKLGAPLFAQTAPASSTWISEKHPSTSTGLQHALAAVLLTNVQFEKLGVPPLI
jgi:hypothetical protein